MSYTRITETTKICTKCHEPYPNTKDFFNRTNGNGLAAVCKKCSSAITKERNQKTKEKNQDLNLFYDWEQECKKCHRKLPFNKLYYPSDKTTKYGLRFVCRECNPKYSGFLDPDYVKPDFWTDEEIELLREKYMYHTNEEIQLNFFPNRSLRAIESCAYIHGFNIKTMETKKRSRTIAGEKTSQALKGRTFSPEHCKNISESKKEYFKNHDGWWLGKKRSPEQVEMIRQRTKGKWAGTNNPRFINPLCGADNGRWKGGVTSIRDELRSDTRPWQIDSFVFSNHTCVITGQEGREIHHTTSFQQIYEQAFILADVPVLSSVKDYTDEQMLNLRETIFQLHQYYGYGACLCHLVHKKFHDEYGYNNATPSDFLNFMSNVIDGKYASWFEDNNLPMCVNMDYYHYLENLVAHQISSFEIEMGA